MELYFPNYFSNFHCLAEQCPHSCCTGWEVLVDEASAAWYQTVSGELGDRLRRALCRDGEEWCFSLSDGRCPFLEKSGLCELHRRLGEEHTSLICRTHPRFIDDYGSRREISLGASCPEAARLVLASEPALLCQRLEQEGEGKTPELLSPLLAVRETALSILELERSSMPRRLTALLLFANDAQALIDEGEEERMPALCAAWTETPFEEVPPVSGEAARSACIDLLSLFPELEILGRDWETLVLDTLKDLKAGTLSRNVPPAAFTRRTAQYFLFRHWLHAAWDGDLLSQAELTVLAVCVIALLSRRCGFSDALRLFCREIEHCTENLEALREAFCRHVGLETFFSALALPALL